MRSMPLKIRILCLLILTIVSQASPIRSVKVLARAGGASLTSRQLFLYWVTDDPQFYLQEKYLKWNSLAEKGQKLEELITQVLVNQENRILSTYQISNTEMENLLMAFKKVLGPSWNNLLKDWDTSETEIKKYLAERWVVDSYLTEKAKAGRVEEWLNQLRSRYRVLYFKQ